MRKLIVNKVWGIFLRITISTSSQSVLEARFPVQIFHSIYNDIIILQKRICSNSVNYLTVHEANAITTTKAKKGTVGSASGIKR